MDVDTLKTKRQDIENKFDDVKAKKEIAESQVAELDTELYRLQGEYRILNDLIESYPLKGEKRGKKRESK